MSPELSILMPVFNEKSTLRAIVERVLAVPLETELIIVDNCSTDGSREELQAIEGDYGRRLPGRVQAMYQEVNRGKGSSVRRALEGAGGEWVIVQDADLEYDPQDYIKLLEVARREHAAGREVAVFGSRLQPRTAARTNQPHTPFYFGRLGLSLIFRLLYGSRLSDVATCYKLMQRETARRLRLRSEGFDLDFEIAARLTRCRVPILEVPISYHPRTEIEGKKIRAGRDGWRALCALMRHRWSQ